MDRTILIVIRDISQNSAGLATSTFLRYKSLNLINNYNTKILTSRNILNNNDLEIIENKIKPLSIVFYKEFIARVPSLKYFKKIYKTIRTSSIIYIFSFYQPISYLSFIFGLILGKEIWFRPHGHLIKAYTVKFSMIKKIYTNIELYLYSFSKYIVLSSELEKNDFLDYVKKYFFYKKLKNKLVITNDSYDIKENTYFSKNVNLEKNYNSRVTDLLFFSRLVEIKGINLFLDALVYLCKEGEIYKNLRIKIAGIPSAQFCSKYEKAKEIFVKNKFLEISYEGNVSQQRKWELFNDSKNYILPTYGDSFGISAIEALFSNNKVASTKYLGCAKLIDDLDEFTYIDLSVFGIAKYIKSIISADLKQEEPNHDKVLQVLSKKLSINKQSKDYEKLLKN